MEITFNSLAFEVQMQICSYLSLDELQHLFAPVCKKWKLLATQPVLRREITLDGKLQSVKTMNNTIRNSYKIGAIRFNHILNWYVLSRSLPTCCNNLRRFEFIKCNITATCIKRLVTRFPAVEGVKLVFISGKFNSLVVRTIAEWRFLKDISIDAKGFRLIDGTKMVEFYATKCEYLSQLELINFEIWGRAIDKLTELRGFTLEKLHFGDDFIDVWSNDSDCVCRCLARCPNLKSVSLIPEHGDVSLKNNVLLQELHVSRYWPFLKTLLIRNVYSNLSFLKTELGLLNPSSLPKHCPVLRSLELLFENVSDEDVAFIAHHCRKLERLSIIINFIVTLGSLPRIFRSRTNLSYLEFSSCKYIEKTSANFAILAEARKSNPNLEIVIK